MQVKILAIGAHPDDVELSCSGTLYKHKLAGQKIAIVDLTEGELGSRGTVETRYAEAKAAGEILKIDARENLQMPDGFIENNKENRLKVVKAIRTYQPEIILCNAPQDRHPDHGHSSSLVRDAAFLAGLIKIETGQAPWRPKKIFYYIQDYYLEPDFIVDISESFATKLESIRAYTTQFHSKEESNEPKTYISSEKFLKTIEYRAHLFGKRIGREYGEGFLLATNHLGINSLDDIVLPEIA